MAPTRYACPGPHPNPQAHEDGEMSPYLEVGSLHLITRAIRVITVGPNPTRLVSCLVFVFVDLAELGLRCGT